MRAVLASLMAPLLGCSSLLGIENPSAGDHRDGGVDAPDAPASDHLVFSTGDFQLAQQQSVRVHVVFVHANGTMEDVTQTATYSSDNEAVVAIGGPGIINSVNAQSGTATITATLGNALPASVKATVKTTLCHPVINEFATATSASADEEWIEVYNPCTDPIDVAGWTLNYRGANTTGPTDSNGIVTLTGQMAPGEIRLFGSMKYLGPKDGSWPSANGILGGTSGAIGLRSGATGSGTIVDSVGYGTVAAGNPFLEGTAAPAMSANVSASRSPFDGKDDDSGMLDFQITTAPTPRAPNAP
ncbi:MAG TPA: lamin tail domain-containing protein [Kofleriaceae bacterium]|nr:lamin tail domain-containing protein [Kofleriaceae bacterium]